jgi:hypothetical protein
MRLRHIVVEIETTLHRKIALTAYLEHLRRLFDEFADKCEDGLRGMMAPRAVITTGTCLIAVTDTSGMIGKKYGVKCFNLKELFSVEL